MARIPLQTANRNLDTGSVVQYPSGSPVGSALAQAGNVLGDVAARFKQKQDQRDEFDANIVDSEFRATLPGVEDEAIRNAPADASGLHDGVYGQIDPSGKVAKPGSFDTLFDRFLERMPESKRPEFAAKREVYRAQGSNRMAKAQYEGEQAYYDIEIQKVQNHLVNSISAADPNDDQSFEAFRAEGISIIDRSGLPALKKDVAKQNWLANADETLFKSRLAKDPSFAQNARSALGLAPPATKTTGEFTGVASRLITDLARDFQIEPYQAAGIVGQLGHESGGFKSLQEINPLIPGSRGGFGYAQWTGPRRKQFEAFARQNNLDPTSYEANYGFLKYELGQTNEGSVLSQVRLAKDARAAGRIFTDKFLRPGIPGYDSRDKWTDRALASIGAAPASSTPSSQTVDPRFANIPFERRLVLANQADVEVSQMQQAARAQMTAAYTQHKDALELQIVQGGVRDENIIANDTSLNDGDKATLISKVRTQNKDLNQVQADLAALTGKTLSLDPYAADDRKRADNMYDAAVKRLPVEQQGAIGTAIIEQTGVAPQSIINAMRKGLSSTNASEVEQALQAAQRISSINPAAIARRDGGGEVQKAADEFKYYVNDLNLEPQQAAQRIIEGRDPAKQRERKALEPAAKEFRKVVADEDLASFFDESWTDDPSLGFTESQAAGIKADFAAIAEEKFFQANGDAERAKALALDEMKRLYGVTRITGAPVVMKHPPERYWPTSTLMTDSAGFFTGPEKTLGYAKAQLRDDILGIDPEADTSTVQFITLPETDAMVKRGELPAYGVLYKDKAGQYQTLAGKVWRPDVKKALEFQGRVDDQKIQDARVEQEAETQTLQEMQVTPADIFTRKAPPRLATDPLPAVKPAGPETLQNKLDERREQLFENAPEPSVGGAM